MTFFQYHCPLDIDTQSSKITVELNEKYENENLSKNLSQKHVYNWLSLWQYYIINY